MHPLTNVHGNEWGAKWEHGMDFLIQLPQRKAGVFPPNVDDH